MMKDLFIPPTPTRGSNNENTLELERSASVVRHIEPEDPYDDNNYRTLKSSSMQPPPRPHYGRSTPSQDSYASSYAPSSRPMSRQDYPVAPPSRQASNTSSVLSGSMAGSAVSGSENWETYTDNSDNEEADATEAYHAKVKAQQLRHQQHQQCFKRPATATAIQMGGPKRIRENAIAEEGTVEGSEAGWTDDGEIGDTY